MDQTPPTQLRLGIDPPRGRVVLGVRLEGLTVVTDIRSGSASDVRRYFTDAGIELRRRDNDQLTFPVVELSAVGRFPVGAVILRCEPTLEPLVRLARRGQQSAATVDITDGQLRLTWWDDDMMRSVTLDDATATALCRADLPFVATPDAWAHLERAAAVPHTLGRARLGHDGYIEITATRPQLVESLPVPGLFRITQDRFGVPVVYSGELANVSGIAWDGTPPVGDVPDPSAMRDLGVELADPTRRLCARLVNRAGMWGAALLVAGPGRARRTVAAAATEALDGWPALVLCPPWSLWAWWRTMTLVGRPVDVRGGTDGDVRLMTWMDLARGARFDAPATIICDDLAGTDAGRAINSGALRRLDAVAGATRIGVCEHWPEDPEEGCRLANIIRPGEFDLGGRPLAWRYPLRPAARAAEHLRAWTVAPTEHEDITDVLNNGGYRHSQVRIAALNSTQRAALAELAGQPDRLEAALEIVSVGAQGTTSPKIAVAVEEAQRGIAAGRGPVAIWVLHRRAATLLRAALAGHSVTVTDRNGAARALEHASQSNVVIVCDTAPGNLTAAGVVVVDTLAVSFDELDDAVGASNLAAGPSRVAVIHSPDGPDDRLAAWAAGGGNLDSLDEERRSWLMAPRWAPRSSPATGTLHSAAAVHPESGPTAPTAVAAETAAENQIISRRQHLRVAPRIPGAGDT